MQTLIKLLKLTTLLAACLALSSCDNVRVYGSVGYSAYGGYGGYGGYGTRVGVGGRIY